MQLHNFVIDALDQVLTWNLSDEANPQAMSAEVALLRGLDSEQVAEDDLD